MIVAVILAAASLSTHPAAPSAFAPSAEAVNVAKSFDLGPPLRRLNGISLAGTTTFQHHSEPARSEQLLLGQVAPGVRLSKESDGTGGGFAIDWTMNGLIKLRHAAYLQNPFKRPTYAEATSYLSIDGDFKKMPVGGHFSYKYQRTYFDSANNTTSNLSGSVACSVKTEVKSNIFSSSLSGLAKKITCSTSENGKTTVNDYVFLEDYKWFVNLGAHPNDFYYDIWHIVGIK